MEKYEIIHYLMNVQSPYVDMLLSKYSPCIFTNKIPQCLLKYNLCHTYVTLYICSNGFVVGQAEIVNIFAPQYGENFGIANQNLHTKAIIERFYYVRDVYLNWCLRKGIRPNYDEGWFKSKKFTTYLEEIKTAAGSKNQDFNYIIMLSYPYKYDIPKPLSSFIDIATKKSIDTAPENICEVWECMI